VAAGWREFAGGAELELLWPREDFAPRRANDTSMVLSIRAAGRRLLLNGDIQEEAIDGLLSRNIVLKADITDLPHHGSFVEASPRWFHAVAPSVVLQSTGPARLIVDRWAGMIDPARTRRLISDREGMVEVVAARDGAISWSSFKGGKIGER
jgi:hypothetical protein